MSSVNLTWERSERSSMPSPVVYGSYFSVENEGLRGCLLFKICNNNYHLFKYPVLCFSENGGIRVIDFDLSVPAYGFRQLDVDIRIKRIIIIYDSKGEPKIPMSKCYNTSNDRVYIFQSEHASEPSFLVPVYDKDGHRKTSPDDYSIGSLFYYYVELNSGNIIKLASKDFLIPVEIHMKIKDKKEKE